MPSSQSDGVQSLVISRFPEMIFLPIETAGEGEINAHSRVQMALGEAKAKARAEFDRCLESAGRRLDLHIKQWQRLPGRTGCRFHHGEGGGG
jgi:predicted nucleotide-binding protein (sugar kinase/HSP70/actin superfamily)